jgi:hypothetical protein
MLQRHAHTHFVGGSGLESALLSVVWYIVYASSIDLGTPFSRVIRVAMGSFGNGTTNSG